MDTGTIRGCQGFLQSFKSVPSNQAIHLTASFSTSAGCLGQANIPSMRGMLIKASSSPTRRFWTNLLWRTSERSTWDAVWQETETRGGFCCFMFRAFRFQFTMHRSAALCFVSFLATTLGECLKIGRGPFLRRQFQFWSITIVRRHTECLEIRVPGLQHAICWWTPRLQRFLTEFQPHIIFTENANEVEKSLRDIFISTTTKNGAMEFVGANETCTMY
jgi:hypothetical protein